MKKLFTLAVILLSCVSYSSAQYVTKALNENDEPTFNWDKASDFVIFAAGDAEREAMQTKGIKLDLSVNDLTTHLYVWENTYVGGDGSGMNSFGELEDCIALVVSSIGWSGCGFFHDGGTNFSFLDDTYVLHFAIKSRDNASHCIGLGEAKFALGTDPFIDNGQTVKNLGEFERNGEWYYVDIPFSVLKQCAANNVPFPNNSLGGYNGNHFWALSGGTQGVQLNLDNIFLYKDNSIISIPDEVYVLGEVNGNSWAPNVGVKMETEDHETYTATITTVGESGGGSYFSFTTKLAENASDWDGIAPYRFGAELNGEGDFWITPELVGTTLHLGEMGTQRAYRLEAGQWLFNLNLTDGTFVVTSLAPGPDVDGNGIVDIADMNIVIDVILGLDQNPKADVDGNGIVDIADMNIVIDAILGN